jgi:hypothetical protein
LVVAVPVCVLLALVVARTLSVWFVVVSNEVAVVVAEVVVV